MRPRRLALAFHAQRWMFNIRRAQSLPRIESVSFDEAMALLEHRMLWDRGLGWIDIHLLASTLVSGNILWTRDRLLRRVADKC